MSRLKNSRRSEIVSIDVLKPYDNDAFIFPRSHHKKLSRIYQKVGQAQPIIIAPDNTIIAGEDWWQVLREAGQQEVEVFRLEDLTKSEEKAVRLTLHRLPLNARLNRARLKSELLAIQAAGIDLDLTGFEQAEIDFTLELDIPSANVSEDLGAIPLRPRQPVSRPGDIFQLGPHRIACGDARDTALLKQLRQDLMASAAFIDPPYNIPIAGFVSGKGRHKHSEFIEGSGEMPEAGFYQLLLDASSVLIAHCRPSALLYLFMDWRSVVLPLVAARQLQMQLINICIWVKSNGGMGGLYRNQHEMVAVFKAGSEPHQNNVELGRFGRNRSNVWSYPGMTAFGKDRDELLAAHPTVKPVALVSDALRDCTKRGELVIDTFLGSGTTLVAAEETGRVCVGTELDPVYLDVAIRRWQQLTGRDAIHVSTGQRFDDLARRYLSKVNEVQGVER